MYKKFRGSAKEAMKKYPSISSYLSAKHPEVYKLMEEVGMLGALVPKGKHAITFLLPDANYQKEIRAIENSNEPEEATDIFASLILLDLFQNVDDFKSKSSNIPNLLMKKVTVKSASGSKVLIDNGELTLDTDFVPLERSGLSVRGNLAVWKLTGKVEYKNAEPAKFPERTTGHSEKKKGGHYESSKLCLLKNKIIEEELNDLKAHTLDVTNKYKSTIANAIGKFCSGLLLNQQKYATEIIKAKTFLTGNCFIDFMIIFHNDAMFNEDKILEIYEAGAFGEPITSIRNLISLPVQSTSVLLQNPTSFKDTRDKIFQVIKGANKKIQSCKTLLENLSKTNNLEWSGIQISNVFDPSISEFLKMHTDWLISFYDQCYLIYCAVNSIRTTYVAWDASIAIAYKDFFTSYFGAYKSIGCSKTLLMEFNQDNQLTDAININMFIDTMLLYVATPYVEQTAIRTTSGRGEDEEEELEEDNYDGWDKMLDEYDNSEFTLSSNTKAELMSYAKKHGKVPTMEDLA
jgi:hypothetical protein